ncbi:hypothetical protein MTR_7g106300 [Medicago truncatula]|uniref:Uncharacterized protein n=1 Tax=Medicago truncatula TaxID=3880 RepID=A0A072U516_MEDTR|nr:hypothetical protein MTR_7g106300 [Medicago truncatula]
MGRVKLHYHGSGDGFGYGHLDTHRVWGRALKLLSTRVQTRVYAKLPIPTAIFFVVDTGVIPTDLSRRYSL